MSENEWDFARDAYCGVAGMTYEEYVHSDLPEIENAEAERRYGGKKARRHWCYEVIECPLMQRPK